MSQTNKPTIWDTVPLILDVYMAADLLSVHRNTIMAMLKDGRLEGVKVGRAWRIEKQAIRDLLDGRTQKRQGVGRSLS